MSEPQEDQVTLLDLCKSTRSALKAAAGLRKAIADWPFDRPPADIARSVLHLRELHSKALYAYSRWMRNVVRARPTMPQPNGLQFQSHHSCAIAIAAGVLGAIDGGTIETGNRMVFTNNRARAEGRKDEYDEARIEHLRSLPAGDRDLDPLEWEAIWQRLRSWSFGDGSTPLDALASEIAEYVQFEYMTAMDELELRAALGAVVKDGSRNGEEIAAATDERPAVLDNEPGDDDAEPSMTLHDGHWHARFSGESIILDDLVGLRYVAELLSKPGRPVSALDLAGRVDAMGNYEVVDRRAITEAHDRLSDVESDIECAKSMGDLASTDRLQAEREDLQDYLRQNTALSGRSRVAGGDSEKARKSVFVAIRRAIDAVTQVHPELGKHLDARIRTGGSPRYEPVDGDPDWIVTLAR